MAAIRKPFQSKLIPHLEFTRECRGRGVSYPCISAELRALFGVSAAASTICAFVKVRARRRVVFALPTRETSAAAPPRQAPPLPRLPARPHAGLANWLNYDPEKPLEKLTPSP
jgi:hypothetical protein